MLPPSACWPARAHALADWRGLLRAGDWLVLLLAALLRGTVPAALARRRGRTRHRRANGEIVAEVRLTEPRNIAVTGPLGTTRIEIEPGRARVVADPGPRQYCVRQGWLTRPNGIAICAPEPRQPAALAGRNRAYDSLNY